jgi:peptide/nickel transport system substrate-binding protein
VLKGEIVYGMVGDPVIFNPILATDTPSGNINTRVYQGLVRSNEKLEMVPYLAKSITYSDDGKTWTVKLNEGVKWHDGEPFTAEDVKFTYDTIMHPDYTGVRKSNFSSVESVEITGELDLILHLKKPDASLLSKLNIGIIPKHIFGEIEVAKLREHPANMEPIGTGPYKWGEWAKGQYIALVANEDYWGEGPWIQQVRYKFYQDNQVMLSAFEAGEIDYMGSIPPDDVERVKTALESDYHFYNFPANGYTYFGLMQTHPILGEKAIRQALAYGLDRQKIVDTIYQGYATVLNTNMPPISWAYKEGLNNYAYNKQKAIQLLEEAGWDKVGSDGIRLKDGKPLSFTLVTASGNTQYEAVLAVTQEQWKEIGVDVKVEYYEWSVLVEKYLDAGKFEAYMLAWSLGLDPDCYLFWHSSAGYDEEGLLQGFNDCAYYNDRMDELLEQGRVTMDQEERKKIYGEVQTMLNEDLPNLFLYTQNFVTGMHKKFGGVVMSPIGPIFPELWYIEEGK